MQGLSFVLAVIAASLIQATCLEAQGNCTALTSEWLSGAIKRLRAPDDFDLVIEIRGSKILCNSHDYNKRTVLSLYSHCNETLCSPETESVILDVTCAEGMWELTHYSRMSNETYYTISTDNANCSDCLDVDLFHSRNYPMNPPDNLVYNEMTHCLCK